MPSIAGDVYAVRDDAAYVNLFIVGEGKLEVGGHAVTLRQTTKYPWDGKVEIAVDVDQPQTFELRVRIPGWATGSPVPSDLYHYLESANEKPSLKVGGEAVAYEVDHGFASIRREWKRGDTVTLDLPMTVRRVIASEKVEADRGLVALERGPIVFCLEGVDHGGEVRNIAIPDDAKITAQHRPDLLGGVTTLSAKGVAISRQPDGSVAKQEIDVTAIPYYAWDHRGPGPMTVWLPRRVEDAYLPPIPTLASKSRASASHVWQTDTAEALHDLIEPRSSNDQSIPRFTWWDHRGTSEWVAYELPAATMISGVEVYWFDDGPGGGCRVPASWRVLYREDEAWKPVTGASDYGVAKDQYNALRFDPIETTALRLEVQLQPAKSSGILEWKLITPQGD